VIVKDCVSRVKNSKLSNSSNTFELHFFESSKLNIIDNDGEDFGAIKPKFQFYNIDEILDLPNGHIIGNFM